MAIDVEKMKKDVDIYVEVQNFLATKPTISGIAKKHKITEQTLYNVIKRVEKNKELYKKILS